MASRAYTVEEARDIFLDEIRTSIDYWDNIKDRSQRERLEGLAFSIMTILDGENLDLPSFLVVPDPHLGDKLYRIGQGKNYFPEGGFDLPSFLENDIAGELHDRFNEKRRNETGK